MTPDFWQGFQKQASNSLVNAFRSGSKAKGAIKAVKAVASNEPRVINYAQMNAAHEAKMLAAKPKAMGGSLDYSNHMDGPKFKAESQLPKPVPKPVPTQAELDAKTLADRRASMANGAMPHSEWIKHVEKK